MALSILVQCGETVPDQTIASALPVLDARQSTRDGALFVAILT